MIEYHKIQTMFKRDPATKFKTLLQGEWSEPEFEYLQSCDWVATEKVDGTNIRVTFKSHLPEELTYQGRTDKSNIPPKLLIALQDVFEPLNAAGRLGHLFNHESVTFYGEGYGAKIQKVGANYRSDNGFVLFDIKIGDWWLRREDLEEISDSLGLDIVPVVAVDTLDKLRLFVQKGFKSTWGDFPAEGIVARPKVELRTRSGHRIITKLKHKDFTHD